MWHRILRPQALETCGHSFEADGICYVDCEAGVNGADFAVPGRALLTRPHPA